MSTVLLVDDSPSILAANRAALDERHTLVTAADGGEGLEQVRRVRPDLVVLDLSMPVMDGLEVLRTIRGEPAIAATPVLILSSEVERTRACIEAGANAFLAKPVRADALVAMVDRLLAQGDARRLAVLPVEAGGVAFALPLETVRRVLPQVATRRVPAGPSFLREVADIGGEAVLVLDLAARLGVPHAVAIAERRLVLVAARLACCVDVVEDPFEATGDAVMARPDVGGAALRPFREALSAIVRAPSGRLLPVVDAAALVRGESHARLPMLRRFALDEASDGEGGANEEAR